MVRPAERPAPAPPPPDVAGEWPIALRLPEHWVLSDECLMEISELNRPWRFERGAEGDLEISAPSGFRSGSRGDRIAAQLIAWAERTGGQAGGADIGFRMPDGAVRSPDAWWASDERLRTLDPGDEGFATDCPDLVVEVRSRSDSLASQQRKMDRWLSYGVRLGWLIDPYGEHVWVYRPDDESPERLDRPDSLTDPSVLPRLSIDLGGIWP